MTEDERDNLLRYRRNNRIEKLKDKELNKKMNTYCLVCKNYTDNSNSRVVKNKQRLMLKSNYLVCGNKKKYVYFKGVWFT